jgi:hypothetical protein
MTTPPAKHAVAFSKPNQSTKWFYDFETSKWIGCVPVERLPYNLCSYRLDGEDKYVVTCEDSYRLIDDLTNAPKVQWLEEERAWREELVCKESAELDFIKTLGAIKAQVLRKKSDIVPNVLVISPRKYQSQIFGYYYYESAQLAKSSTLTPVLTQEDLGKEKEIEAKATEMQRKHKEELNNVKTKLIESNSFKCYKKYEKFANQGIGFCGKCGFFDITEYYQSLRFYPHPITQELINEYCEANGKEISQVDCVALFGCVLFNSKYEYDVFYDSETKQIEKDSFVLGYGDAYANIKVFGGTWGKIKISFEGELLEIPMNLVDEYLTFSDITLQNPIFKSVSGGEIKIFTDGIEYTADRLIFDNPARRIINSIGNTFAVTKFPSKNLCLFLGHVWQPSFICELDQVIPVEYIEDK